MRLGAKTRYAVAAMLELSQGRDRLSLSEISIKQNIPQSFLEQVFQAMRKNGLVTSERGQAGGFRLSRSPAEITLFDIISALGEPIRTNACDPHEASSCTGLPNKCMAHDVWHDLAAHIQDFLKSMSLAEVASRHQQKCGHVERIVA